MDKLKTNYLGLTLKNPIIVSSSGLTNSIEKLKKLEAAGAGAVILKSLFEEQIKVEAGILINESEDYPEASDYINSYVKNNSLSDYLQLIEDAKKSLKIPVIASINCYSANEWISFAKEIEHAGADALELNIFYLPSDKDFTSEEYENLYFNIITSIKETVKIPFAIKLGSNFTNLCHVIDKFYYRGASGVVLFNRFYEPDIDIETLKFKSAEIFSSPGDLRQTLRWVSLISSKIEKIDVSASTGVHSGEDAIKLILAGAKTIQVCSAIYKKGPGVIDTILKDITKWMESKKYKNISDFQGILNYKNITDPAVYERAQFMKYFSSLE